MPIAHSGREALTIFEQFDPAFVLLDIGMPDMDGYEVAGAIRSRYASAHPVLVAFTGCGQTDRTRARDAGFNGRLVKPTDLRTLKTILDPPPPPPHRRRNMGLDAARRLAEEFAEPRTRKDVED